MKGLSDLLSYFAVSLLLTDKERENVEAHEQELADKFGVSVQEIRNKRFGWRQPTKAKKNRQPLPIF